MTYAVIRDRLGVLMILCGPLGAHHGQVRYEGICGWFRYTEVDEQARLEEIGRQVRYAEVPGWVSYEDLGG